MKKHLSVIQNFIEASTSSVNYNRGELLFKQQSVEINRIENNGDTIKGLFFIHGSRPYPYEIEINILKGNKISSQCTCIYNFSDLCEHEVASFMQLKLHLVASESVKEKEKRATPSVKQRKGWFFLPVNGDQGISRSLVNGHATSRVSEMAWMWMAELRRSQGNEFLFHAVERFDFYSDSSVSSYYETLFEVIDQGIYSTCDCRRHFKSLCEHQVAIS